MRNTLPSIALLLVTVLSVPGASGQDLDHAPLCEAVLYQDRAEFLFPILDADEWRWYRRETAPDSLEYAWEVMLPADRPGYVFGIYLAKAPGQMQRSGSLDQLLDQTHWNAALLVTDPQGDISPVALPKTQLAAELRDGGVVLTLLDADSLQRFFQERPQQALFNLLHPDEIYAVECLADIRYPKADKRPSTGRDNRWQLQLP